PYRHTPSITDTATTEIYPLSLHDALPIWFDLVMGNPPWVRAERLAPRVRETLASRYTCWRHAATRGFAHLPDLAVAFIERANPRDRKSTRLNSSHVAISYAVFCLKKKTAV